MAFYFYSIPFDCCIQREERKKERERETKKMTYIERTKKSADHILPVACEVYLKVRSKEIEVKIDFLTDTRLFRVRNQASW